MGDCYVLGFVPALRFCQSKRLCRLYKSPLDETINWGPLCVYAWKKLTYACRLHGAYQNLVDCGNSKINQHAPKVSRLQNAEVGHDMEEEERGLHMRVHVGLEMQNMHRHFHTKQLHMSTCTIFQSEISNHFDNVLSVSWHHLSEILCWPLCLNSNYS